MSRILVVDDEKSIRKTFEAFLTKEGHEVDIAENVDVAFKFMKQNIPDLIFTDIIMPKITGMELLKAIKKINSDVPVIVMTGEPTVETAKQSVKESAFDYLTKPINKEKLLRAANNALEHKELLESKKRLEDENKEYRENLEKLVQARTIALHDTIHATISTIMSMVELRDPYTAGHERRVGNLAIAIGKKMRLPKAMIDCIAVTGYLHDIGKISVPAEILSKPGKLTAIEFEMIKAHVVYGYDVLKKVNLPWPIADVVYQHHERMNGSGYPRNLKGDALMIEAKIMAVADVIEAMMSHRPYRPSLGQEVALDEIESNKGVLYDADVANAALGLFRNDNYEMSDAAMPSLNFNEYDFKTQGNY